ncbi:potassium channel subfamily K member 18 [Diorhabda sublineata]|uniref:potassium channel subfamily K member 18 n=1 Tax=Diorhabda sublineata TaxID=1163346 RepID=UPI0024E0F5F7|nr:potassium channel subfamily K member 18 [Diorhabda sublineata]XP_056633474.1 potassium channel subfamily K member 18 [Diorhabda sublineata]
MERKKSFKRQKRYRRPWLKKCKEFLRQFIAFLFSNLGIILLVVGYTIAGSFIFMAIEGKQPLKMKEELKNNRSKYADELWNITYELNKKILDEKEYHKRISEVLEKYQTIIVKFIKKGYDGTDDADSSSQWSFAGAFLYSLTVITTIGYGNIYPRTLQGKIATIVYAIIGMPLFLLYLSNIGDIMARSFKWIYAKCCLCRCCPGVARRRAIRALRREESMQVDYVCDDEKESEASSGSGKTSVPPLGPRESILSETYTIDIEEDDVQNIPVPVTVCLTIMVGYICSGALLFCKWEDHWSFMDASYFCFISLSTIGFGDLVPGDKIYGRGRDFYTEVLELSFVFCSIYLMLGMALIAMCFNLMQEEVINKIQITIRTVKYILRCNR